MGIHTQVGAIGSAIHAPRDPGSTSLEEALHPVTHAALRNAGLTIDHRPGIEIGRRPGRRSRIRRKAPPQWKGM